MEISILNANHLENLLGSIILTLVRFLQNKTLGC